VRRNRHNIISVAKGILRVMGFIFLPINLITSAMLLIAAEIGAIIERYEKD